MAVSTGRLDALAFCGGVLGGIFAYGEVYPSIAGFVTSTSTLRSSSFPSRSICRSFSRVSRWSASPLVVHILDASEPLNQYLFTADDGRIYALR